MDKKLSGLKKRLAKARANGERRYPTGLRDEVVAAARTWRANGGRRRELIDRLGIKATTFDYWLRRERGEADAAVRPVELVEEEQREGLVAFLNCGVVVEGLGIEDLIALARGLD